MLGEGVLLSACYNTEFLPLFSVLVFFPVFIHSDRILNLLVETPGRLFSGLSSSVLLVSITLKLAA